MEKRPLKSAVATVSLETVASENGAEGEATVAPANGSSEPLTLAQVEAEIEVALASGELSLQDKFALFEKRLKAALTDTTATIPSTTLEKLLRECDAAIGAAQQEAIDARERGLNFLATPDIKAAREAVDDAEFFVSRLLTQRPRLAALLDARRAQEQRDRYLTHYATLKHEGEALAQELADLYPGLVGPLVELFARLRAFQQRCSALHVTDPGGLPHVTDPELMARGLAGFSRDLPSLLEAVRLADWASGTEIWPPRSGDFAVSVAQMMTVPSVGAAWADEQVRDSDYGRAPARERAHGASRRRGGANPNRKNQSRSRLAICQQKWRANTVKAIPRRFQQAARNGGTVKGIFPVPPFSRSPHACKTVGQARS